ncbi:hypothetical protein F5887DRAFT_892142, partial [Amanita rubescens]
WPVILRITILGVTCWDIFLVFVRKSQVQCLDPSCDARPEALGEVMPPQPEWWLNGDPYVNGQVSLQGNIDISFRIKGSKDKISFRRKW